MKDQFEFRKDDEENYETCSTCRDPRPHREMSDRALADELAKPQRTSDYLMELYSERNHRIAAKLRGLSEEELVAMFERSSDYDYVQNRMIYDELRIRSRLAISELGKPSDPDGYRDLSDEQLLKIDPARLTNHQREKLLRELGVRRGRITRMCTKIRTQSYVKDIGQVPLKRIKAD
jgi:hypothetical protein